MKDLAKVFMWCYNSASESGALLATQMGIKRIKHSESTFFGGPKHTVVNWGSSPEKWGVKGAPGRIVNHPTNVKIAINKTRFLLTCSNSGKDAPRVPEWTREPEEALEWIKEGHCVLAREQVCGKGGEGIVIMEQPVDLIAAPLYTKYIEKQREFRLYVVNGRVIDFCMKKRKLDETPKNWKIRSRENGFVYCWVDDEQLPMDCMTQAVKAVTVCGLDFGGVDVVFHEASQKAYVLEVNSAPWLSESTACAMAVAIAELVQ